MPPCCYPCLPLPLPLFPAPCCPASNLVPANVPAPRAHRTALLLPLPMPLARAPGPGPLPIAHLDFQPPHMARPCAGLPLSLAGPRTSPYRPAPVPAPTPARAPMPCPTTAPAPAPEPAPLPSPLAHPTAPCAGLLLPVCRAYRTALLLPLPLPGPGPVPAPLHSHRIGRCAGVPVLLLPCPCPPPLPQKAHRTALPLSLAPAPQNSSPYCPVCRPMPAMVKEDHRVCWNSLGCGAVGARVGTGCLGQRG